MTDTLVLTCARLQVYPHVFTRKPVCGHQVGLELYRTCNLPTTQIPNVSDIHVLCLIVTHGTLVL